MSKIITCEQVSNGHPDKICDQIADAIVTDILQHDRNARVAIECLLKKSQLFIAGEVTTDYRPNYNQIVHDVFNRIGTEKLGWNLTELLRIGILVDKQSPDIALGVDKGGAGDQGIMYGYATNETAEQMPIPYMVATKFLQLLKNHPSKMFRADAKAQVSYDYDTGRITTFLCSVQHSPDVEVSDFRHIIESMMVLAACEYGLDGDFTKLVNPTGRFVLGGSYADCGVTGRKLACDTYGGIGRMGGGALSGKTPPRWIAPLHTWHGRSPRTSCRPATRTNVKSSWPTPSVWFSQWVCRWSASVPSMKHWTSSRLTSMTAMT